MKRTNKRIGAGQNKLVLLLITGTLLFLLPSLLTRSISLGGWNLPSIKIFEVWMVLLPLFFLVGVVASFVGNWNESRSLGGLSALIYVATHGAMALFALSMAVACLWEALLGRKLTQFWLKIPGLSAAFLAVLFVACGLLLGIRLSIEALLMMIRFLREGKYLLAILLGAACALVIACLAFSILVL